MARLSLIDQLKKAISEGNLDKAKELSLKIDSKPKPKPKAKVKVKPIITDDEEDFVDNGFMAPAKRKNATEYKEVYTDENGVERVKAKKVPFKAVKNRKNIFKDDLTEATSDIEFDKAVKRKTKKSHREAVEKVKQKCSRCEKYISVWPNEVTHNNWACNDCIARNKRG